MSCLQSKSEMTMTREVEGVGQETFDNPSPSAQISTQKKKNKICATEPWGDSTRRFSDALEQR